MSCLPSTTNMFQTLVDFCGACPTILWVSGIIFVSIATRYFIVLTVTLWARFYNCKYWQIFHLQNVYPLRNNQLCSGHDHNCVNTGYFSWFSKPIQRWFWSPMSYKHQNTGWWVVTSFLSPHVGKFIVPTDSCSFRLYTITIQTSCVYCKFCTSYMFFKLVCIYYMLLNHYKIP